MRKLYLGIAFAVGAASVANAASVGSSQQTDIQTVSAPAASGPVGVYHWVGRAGRPSCPVDLYVDKVAGNGEVDGKMHFSGDCSFDRVFGEKKPSGQHPTVVASYRGGRFVALWVNDGTRFILERQPNGSFTGHYYYVKGHYTQATKVAPDGKVADGKCDSDCTEYDLNVIFSRKGKD